LTGHLQIYTAIADLARITNHFNKDAEAGLYTLVNSEIAYRPVDPVRIGDDGLGLEEYRAEAMMKAVEMLEAEQDVDKVWTNVVDG
jgi:transcriptional/translational regulatory protein YebC/TACO1